MSEPRDQSARFRFAHELDRNFSVVAAAGSGKTYAITERIVQIAASPDALEVLPRLVVVTFTHRAADEMQQRTRHRILAHRCSPELHAAFNRAFFGTIHSFCMKLLASYGHYLGLPTTLDLVTDDAELWEQFVQQHGEIARSLGEENRVALFRYAQARQMMELARNAQGVLAGGVMASPCPQVNFAQVYAAVSRSRASDQTIANSKAELADWERRCAAGWEFVRWPVKTSGAKEFTQRWRDAFAPLRKWVTDAAFCVAAEVQRDYRDFRIERGVVTYADQVALADELMQHPIAARRIRQENFRVILDEAQDTDPTQFSVLTEIARPPEATGRWIETQTAPPRPGHFCMVGDFQQSIYRDRADLHRYRAAHRALVNAPSGEELKFSVTFRLDQRQLDFVNETFREILNNEDGQVEFVELQPRPDILPGQVIRLALDASLLPKNEKLRDYRKARIEAKALAEWIRAAGLEKLRANSWRDVAVLCPRKLWLRTIAAELRRAGLPVAIQSEAEAKGDNPAYAWLTALCTVMTDPLNSYEIVGVLREVFGIADHDLAVFAEGIGTRFQIEEPIAASGIVSSPLRLLAETRLLMRGRALFDAINILIDQMRLRERLASLPAEDFPNLQSELDNLVALAAEAEGNGATIVDFARKLRDDFPAPRETRRSSDDGIQLITAQKSKGSEWQAVILPFLGRGIVPPSPRYPCILKVPGTNEPFVALDKDDFYEETRALTKTAVEQEMARLLYVATTRARHTLVLVYDRDMFVNSKASVPPTAQLKHFGDETPPIFEKISTTPEACPRTARANAAIHDQRGHAALSFPAFDESEKLRARQRAAEFVRTVKPSAYDPEVAELGENGPAVIYLRSIAESPATLYGQWWHSFFESLDWRSGLPGAEKHFSELHPRSPDPARSAAEWKRMRGGLFNGESVSELIAERGANARAEVPFSWSFDKLSVVEGIMDLLVINPKAGRAFLIDWKTNEIARHGEEALRARYLPQLAAYWKAATEITRLEVHAALFSTALGRLLRYDRSQLSAEWERLARVPADDLRVTLIVD